MFIIDIKNSTIYHNNVKKDFLIHYLVSKTDSKIKDVNFSQTIDRDAFMKQISHLNELSFGIGDPNNLLTENNMMYSEMSKDLFSYGVSLIKVDMKIKDAQDTSKLIKLISKLFKQVDDGSIKDFKTIRIVGKDKNDHVNTFINDKVTAKIELKIHESLKPSNDELQEIISDFKDQIKLWE